jgi:hypothetical protein
MDKNLAFYDTDTASAGILAVFDNCLTAVWQLLTHATSKSRAAYNETAQGAHGSPTGWVLILD